MNDIIDKEEQFHDEWAYSEDLSKIDIKRNNEASTAPEMRFIRKNIGDIKGKSILDVGCGLGEASIYFAIEGAKVTALDLSQGMLDAVLYLAKNNHVEIKIHKSTAEGFNLNKNDIFDIIYVGNLLHHVDIEATLKQITNHLKPNGIMVSWDPLAYNPIINIYRRIATEVRTLDEHPLKLKDIKLFSKYFKSVKQKYFWLTTLIIFIFMYFLQKRDPNKERYWKKIVEESNKWEWIYKPLEILDKIILFLVPPLKLLCWNVVLIGMNPIIDDIKSNGEKK